MLRRSLSVCAVLAASIPGFWHASADGDDGRPNSRRQIPALRDPQPNSNQLKAIQSPKSKSSEFDSIADEIERPLDSAPPANLNLVPSGDEELSSSMQALRSKIRKCLLTYYHEPINVADHS